MATTTAIAMPVMTMGPNDGVVCALIHPHTHGCPPWQQQIMKWSEKQQVCHLFPLFCIYLTFKFVFMYYSVYVMACNHPTHRHHQLHHHLSLQPIPSQFLPSVSHAMLLHQQTVICDSMWLQNCHMSCISNIDSSRHALFFFFKYWLFIQLILGYLLPTMTHGTQHMTHNTINQVFLLLFSIFQVLTSFSITFRLNTMTHDVQHRQHMVNNLQLSIC